MTKILYLASILFLLNACQTPPTSTTSTTSTTLTDSLRELIQKIVSSKNAVVGVSIMGNNGKDTISFNGDKHFPMQSVFKFHIALAVLSEIDKGKFSLDQKIKIEKKDLLPDLYSPLRENRAGRTRCHALRSEDHWRQGLVRLGSADPCA